MTRTLVIAVTILALIPTVVWVSGFAPPAEDRQVDVGTHRLQARIVGEGTPAIVIDGGVAGRSGEYRALQRRLSEKTRVVTYDRAGYGESEPGPFPRDSGCAADELRTLLQRAGVEGPCLLVGHSLGALNLQVFAARHPDDVAAMVLLDPPPLAWLRGEGFPSLREMARRMTEEWQAQAERGLASSNEEERAQARFLQAIASEHREMFGESARLAGAIESFGDLPLLVIASGVANPAFGEGAEEYQNHWIEESRLLSRKSTRGEFLLIEESSHMLHLDAEDDVVERVLSLLEELRTTKGS